jgi:hypothetical protein
VDGAYNQAGDGCDGALGVPRHSNGARTVSGLGKTAKTVAIMNGPQHERRAGSIGTERQGRPEARGLPHAFDHAHDAIDDRARVSCYADSIGNGYNGSPQFVEGLGPAGPHLEVPAVGVLCRLRLRGDAAPRKRCHAARGHGCASRRNFNPAKLWIALA